MKLPVNGTEEHEGKALQFDTEKETITLLDYDDEPLGTITWQAMIEFVQASQHKNRANNSRRDSRARLAVKVRYRTPDGKQFEGLTSGIGAGGLFIEASIQLPFGTDLDVEFLLPDNPWERINAHAKVAWLRTQTERYILPPGMGLRFTGITPENRMKIEQLVNALNRARER